MICPNCQTRNPDGARFCIACGQPLPRVCPVCGALNPPGARFCNQCGAALGSQPNPSHATAARAAASDAVAALGASPPASGIAPAPAVTQVATAPANGYAAATVESDLAAQEPADEEQPEQRRIVTALFADLTSSTALADGVDPEETRALLAAFFATMTHEVHRHGGSVEKYIGDAVMAVFGLPVAHEDDPVRAVRAALDMQAALQRFNAERQALNPAAPELRMRIGVNTGEVVAASGDAEGRDFLITGDAVNVAARVQQAAPPGSVLVGPRTYRSTSGAVLYRALPPIEARGKSRPLPVWEALGMTASGAAPAPRPRGVQGTRTPLIGRDVELSLLTSLYTLTRNERRAHLVTILGAPGVGKTRLAREFMGRQAGPSAEEPPNGDESPRREPPLLLIGRCPSYGEGVTYWPLAEMLRALCGISALEQPQAARAKVLAFVSQLLSAHGRADDPEILAAYLGYTIGVEAPERRQALLPGESGQLREGMFRAWRTLFELVADDRGLIALVDDIHWADDNLLDLLDYLTSRVNNAALLLICTARQELLERRAEWGGGKRNYAVIALEALAPRDAERLVLQLLPGETTPESLRQGILRKTEGNPFYIEEIVRMLVDRGILIPAREVEQGVEQGGDGTPGWRVAPEWEGSEEVSDPAIPDTVQGVLAARLDLLDEVERQTLQHASVIGRYFWPSILLELHRELTPQRLAAVLDSLLARELIREADRQQALTVARPDEPVYAFRHALTREVTYDTIPRTRRAHEHARIAEWLEKVARGREREVADLLAQHYRQYYVLGNLARARDSARRQAVRDKVVHYLTLAGDEALSRHAGAKAEGYYSDALSLLNEDALAEDVPARVTLYTKRGDAAWVQIHADDAWSDYREALRLWSAFSAFLVNGVTPDEQPDGAITAPVAQDGETLALAGELAGELAGDANDQTGPAESGDKLLAPAVPLDWRARGIRLYRLLTVLPTRYPDVFQTRPGHDEIYAYLQEGLRLADELGQRETREGAGLLTAQAFFWWSWAEGRGEAELRTALAGAREAVRILEQREDARGASEALDALGNLQALTTDLRGNLESQSRRIQWATRLDDPNETVDIYYTVAMAHTFVGDFEPAVAYGRRALELAEQAESDPLQAQTLRNLTVTYLEWDAWADAIRAGERLLATIARMGGGAGYDTYRWPLLACAIAYARRGESDAADRIARRISEAPERNETQFIALFRARLALARGATREARQLLLNAVELRSARLTFTALPALLAEIAELGARTGDRELYERFAAQALELGWRSGARKALAQANRAHGIVALADARWDDAANDLESALNRFHALGTEWEEARTRYALAGLYRRRAAEGDEALAQNQLARALAMFEALRATRDIARARAALAGGEVRLP